MNLWLRTDEGLEAVVSLAMVSETLPRVREDVHYWKWVIIALHSTLQGYMVLALKGSDGFNVLSKKCQKEWRKAEQAGEPFLAKGRLDTFSNLYRKIQEGRKRYEEDIKNGCVSASGPGDLMLMGMGSKPFKPQGTQTKSVKLLDRLRNDFVHFLPKNWSLHVSGLPHVVTDCIDIIEFLAFECGNVLWYEEENKQRSKEVISKIRTELSDLNLSHAE